MSPAHASIPEDKELWISRYNGPANSEDAATSIVVSPDGSTVFVTGSSRGLGGYTSYDYATVAYSVANGAQLWDTRYNGPANSSDNAASIAVSPDGSTVFVTGTSYNSSGYADYATVAYSAANGAQLWDTRYNGPANDFDVANSIVVSPDGLAVFVTGSSRGVGTSDDYATVAYSVANGAQLWDTRYNGPANSSDHAASIAVSPDGSTVFVTGQSGHTVRATVAYLVVNGAQLWANRSAPINYYDSDRANSIVVSPDGSTVFVTGSSTIYGGSSPSATDYATVAYSAASGAQLWDTRYNGPANLRDEAQSIVVSPDSSTVFVTGSSLDAAFSTHYATVAYSAASGAQLWATRYIGPANFAGSIVVSPDGLTVFVTGSSLRVASTDYATVAYSAANGTELWVTRYDGPAKRFGVPSYNVAGSIAVSPDGSTVFVTGSSYDRATSLDYATIAYPASPCLAGHNESGPVSGPVHEIVEPASGPATGYVHGANCDIVAPLGL